MKRVLLTGASGFVGANLARRLLKDGHELHLLLRPGFQAWRIDGIRHDVRIHELDLQDAVTATRAVASIRPEWIFHLAANGAYSWQNNLSEILATNLLSTIGLVEACLKTGFEAFINTGSSSEYGAKSHAPAETEFLEPNSHYAVAKAAASQFCQFTARREQVSITTLRLYSAYGPFEDPRRLIPMLILRGLQGAFPPLVAPDTARDYVYVEDVVDAYLLAAAKIQSGAGAIYNVGTGIQTTLREVVDVARTVLAIPAGPAWGSMAAREWDSSVWVSDPRKIATELSWKASVAFEGGFRKTSEWFQSEPWIAAHYCANAIAAT